MPNLIPPQSRDLVRTRDMDQCVRCAGRGYEWHHRRSRRVRDDHTHCPCVGVLLCRTCHLWVHAHVFEARRQGLIVSQYQTAPSTVPVFTHLGLLLMDCEGRMEYLREEF